MFPEDVLGIANYAREQTGMTKAQTDEFLSSMSRIIEEGISNGFVRSTKDVASTMRMFYRLSDESPLWQGKYGAERLSRLNSGLAGAMSLSKASDVIAYGAAQELLAGKSVEERSALLGKDAKATGTWVDYMMLLEKGMTPELFKQLAGDIAAIEGDGNIAGQIARWSDLTGVNWTMASQLYQMYERLQAGEDISASEMDKLMEDYRNAPKEGNYESYLTNMQDSLNRLASGIAVMSEADFRKMLEILHKQEGEIGKGSPSVGEQILDALPEPVQRVWEEHASFAVKTADLTNLGTAENYNRWGMNKTAVSTYLLTELVGDAAGEWGAILRGGQKGAQKQMRDEAMDAIIKAASAKDTHKGRIITAEEMIAIFQGLNATGGAAAFNEGNRAAFAAALEEALTNWSKKLDNRSDRRLMPPSADAAQKRAFPKHVCAANETRLRREIRLLCGGK